MAKTKKDWKQYDVWYGNHVIGTTWAKSPQQAANNVCHRYDRAYPYDALIAVPAGSSYPYADD